MGRKKVLEKRQQRLIKKRDALKARGLASNDAAEVRSINEQLEEINEDLQDVNEELNAILQEENKPDQQSGPKNEDPQPTDGEARGQGHVLERRGGMLMASYAQHVPAAESRTAESYLDTMEYRMAFANYVRTGEWNYTAEQRAASDGMVTTQDIGKIIPNTIMKEYIKELKSYGSLYNRVRKLNVQGGVEFPIEELVPEVKWITETTVSNDQAAPEIKTSVQFGYHIAEARIRQSLLSQVVSLEYLEKEIATLLLEAYMREYDNVILNGTGSGQPLGILKDPRVKTGNKVPFTEAELADWKNWRKKLYAKIPIRYRGKGVLIMTAATWETYIMTLADDNNRPLYSETYNVQTGEVDRRFNGTEVLLIESDILKDFDTAAANEAWCIYFKPTDYAINSNRQIGFKRYFDEDKNVWINKGLCIMDGKLLDVNGVFVLTKKTSAA